MAAPLERTSVPGIYKRGGRYVVTYRVKGKQRRESARTLDDARRLKRAREAARDRGVVAYSRVTLAEYATDWVERYHGRGRRGFRDATRDDYRRDLRRAVEFFGDRVRVSDLTPRDVAQYVAALCDEVGPGGRPLTDATVRRIVSPLRACLATAVQENVTPHNPTVGLALPHRPRVEDDDEVRVLTSEQLATFLTVVDHQHRPLFQLLAATGLRVSEAFALQWKHLHVDGSRPHVKVRRALVRGAYGPPKSRQGRRDVPLPFTVVRSLRTARAASEWPQDDDLAFPNLRGRPLDPGNLTRRTLKPAAEEAGAPWAGFHTFRHTCASMLFQRGANAVQVQRWLGHHSAAFTLTTYVHLLDEDLGEPLQISSTAAHRLELGGASPGVAPLVEQL